MTGTETPPLYVPYDPPDGSEPSFSVFTYSPDFGFTRWDRITVNTCESFWYPINAVTGERYAPGRTSLPLGLGMWDTCGRSWRILQERHKLYVLQENAPEVKKPPGVNPRGEPGRTVRTDTRMIRRGDQFWSQELGQEPVMIWSASSDARGASDKELQAQQAVVTVDMQATGEKPTVSTVISLDTGAIEVFRPDVTEWRVIEERT